MEVVASAGVAGGLGMGGYALLRLRQILHVRTMPGAGPLLAPAVFTLNHEEW